jgi:cell division septation protein DedD
MHMTHEERKRPQARKSSGWLATLGGALLLVAVGFGVGLVAGTAYEEPELVAQHLAGRTSEVALGPIDEGTRFGGPDEDVAAAPPSEPMAETEAPTPLGAGALDETREAPPAAPPARASRLEAGGSGFSVQVGAFGSEDAARQLASELGKRGYRSYVAREGEGARYKVRVGPVGSRPEAERVSARLHTELRLSTWILAANAKTAKE